MLDSQLMTFTKQLYHDLGVAEIELVESKEGYSFSFGENFDIFIKSLNPGFYFTAKLGPPPTQKCEDFFTMLMFANLFGQGTGEAVIGLDHEGKMLTLSLALPYQMPYPKFKEHVEEFVNHVDLWQKKRADACAPIP